MNEVLTIQTMALGPVRLETPRVHPAFYGRTFADMSYQLMKGSGLRPAVRRSPTVEVAEPFSGRMVRPLWPFMITELPSRGEASKLFVYVGVRDSDVAQLLDSVEVLATALSLVDRRSEMIALALPVDSRNLVIDSPLATLIKSFMGAKARVLLPTPPQLGGVEPPTIMPPVDPDQALAKRIAQKMKGLYG